MNKKCKIKLVGWDLDGTILDNFELHYLAMQGVFAKDNLNYPTKEDYGQNIVPDWLGFYKNRGVKSEEKEIQEIFHQKLKDLPPARIFKSAKETLEFFSTKKLDQALITHATAEKAGELLRESGIEKIFFEILADLYTKEGAIEKLIKDKNLLPEEVAYVGDTPGDIKAANKIGVVSVAFTKGFAPREVLEKYNPTFIIDDHRELFDIFDL